MASCPRYLSDKKELRRLEELKQIYAQLADKARDAKGTLEIEEEKLRDLRAEAQGSAPVETNRGNGLNYVYYRSGDPCQILFLHICETHL